MKQLTLLAVLLALLAGTARAAESNLITIKLVSVTTKESRDSGSGVAGLPAHEAAVSALHEQDRLYNAVRQFGKPAKAQIGTDTAVLVRFASGRSWTAVTAKLPGGSVRSLGYIRHVGNEALAPVVGGTGRYARTTGWLEIRDVGNTNFAANIYTLRP